MVKREFKMRSGKESMRLRTAEKERVLHSTDTKFLRLMEGKVRQRVLQKSIHPMCWDEDFPYLLKSILGFVQVFSEEAATSLKGFKIVIYPVYVVLPFFGKEYKMRPVQGEYSLVAYVPVETGKSER